ncbi:MAG TPA: tetratricopeptide repeat protein [Planctomycetota bacterium]|nr:tetratricopeptide repeat protein [Planctomycetota bacterium]
MSLLRIAVLAAVVAAAWSGEAGVMFRLDGKPLYFESDSGATDKEKKAFILRFAKPIQETSDFFFQAFQLKKTAFEDFVRFYDPKGTEWEPLVRVRVFANYDAFREDFQKRYETKTIPGAFFGTIRPKDEYGKATGRWMREVATSSEGQTDQQVLRHLYHELGHLFMDTFILYPVEVPSWIEEGTAELFQYRKGNGTDPEEERDQRSAWLVEMVKEESTIPWPEFIKVQNLDNLDFTYQDPLRSTVQYAQAWAVMEFMIDPKSKRGAAFTALLKDFKIEAEKAVMDANRAGLRDQAWHDRVRPWLYPIQEKLFKKHYGADLLSVEGKWKDWIVANYERDVVKKPILRYYRGEWHLIRSNYARDDASREAALAKAEAVFMEAVAATSTMPEAYVGLGRVHLARGNATAANEQFAKAIAAGTDNFEALLYGGLAQIRGGKAADAVAPLKRAVEQRPSHFEANFYLGQALAISRLDPDLAIVHLKRVLDSRRDMTAQVALYEALVHYQRGDMGATNLSLLRAGSANPGDGNLLLMRAIVKIENSELAEATEILEHAKAQGNTNAIALLERLKNKQPMPKLGFSRNGYPTFVDGDPQADNAADGDQPAGDASGAADERDVDAKAKDLFGPGTDGE